MASDGGLVSRIGQISVTVRDLDAAADFYRDTLGLRELFRAGGMAFLRCGDQRVMLALPEEPEGPTPSSILYFEVQDLDGAHAHLVEVGVPFERGPHKVADLGNRELWMAFFRDPDDHLMALMSERTPAA